VREPAVAAQFEAYWQQLKEDPTSAALRTWAASQNPAPVGEAPVGTAAVFSPRRAAAPDMLDWYAERLSAAGQTAMFTAAFGINEKLAAVLAEDRSFLRFILTEKTIPKDQRDLLARERDTVIAVGSTLGRDAKQNQIPGWELDRWYTEELFRRQGHVFYVHTKYLVVDPLTEDPLVFSGSANFSPNSIQQNDENMLLIRGDRRVADIYMTEFDRLFRHFFFRQTVNALAQAGAAPGDESTFLDPTDGWVAQHFRRGSFKSKRRELLR
jgi:phosphatidylserine/phosphatidylglycerophosphate/cardiolipin synthase-like enzyme